jgi:hypothetical protein
MNRAHCCRGAIKVREDCANKVGMIGVVLLICLKSGVVQRQRILASAEDRALRGRNLSAD